MIKITKSPKPTILVDRETTWIAELLQALEIEDTKKAKHISKNYNDPTIRTTLKNDFNNKCGYCENYVESNAYARIDHFKPQKIAPEATFDWNNLILSCEICNSTRYKGDKFPMEDNQPALIHPCNENPDKHLEFDYINTEKQALVNSKTNRGQTTIAILGLNRLKLVKERNEHLSKIHFFIKYLAINKEAKIFLNKEKAANKKFSAFVKALCQYYDL